MQASTTALDFTKMHGLGNDFVVVETSVDTPLPDAARIVEMADRRIGIGFDQLLWVTTPGPDGHAASYRVFNADGSHAEQCGNGVRCIAKLLARGRPKAELKLAGPTGSVTAILSADDSVAVDMGQPVFEANAIPFAADRQWCDPDGAFRLSDLSFGVVSMGNPHAVAIVDKLDGVDIVALGQAVQRHRAFPDSANVGFLEVTSRTRGRLRVFERGAGATRACGSGATAAAVVARSNGLIDDTVTLRQPGGDLVVSWRGPGHSVWLTGPATSVFEGNIVL